MQTMIEDDWLSRIRRDEVREMATKVINGAFDDLERAERRLEQIRRPHPRSATVLAAARARYTLQQDLGWFDGQGYDLWASCTRFGQDEVCAMRDEYVRRAKPVIRALSEALSELPKPALMLVEGVR